MSHDTLRVRLLAFLFLIPLALYAWSAVQAFRVDSTLRDEQFMRDWSASVRNDPDAAGAIPVTCSVRPMASKVIFTSSPKTPRPSAATILGWLCAAGWPLSASSARWRRRWSRPSCWRDWNTTGAARSQAYLLGHLAPAWRRLGRLVPLHAGLLVAALARLLYEALWATATGTATASSPCSSHCRCGCCSSAACSCCGACAANCCRWRNRCSTCSAANSTASPRPASGNGWDRSPTAPERRYRTMSSPASSTATSSPRARSCWHPRHSAGGRTLYIPLTYASVMSEAESAAIIGHELGHFAAGDTAHGASCRSCSGRCACASNASPPRGWACRPARQAGPVGRAVLPRSLRARLPALESPPGTGRRQGRGAGSRRGSSPSRCYAPAPLRD